MNFTEIAKARQSCRSYDSERPVEKEKLDAILAAARLSPSACNSQPYHITVCEGEAARAVADGVMSAGFNRFAKDVPVMLVISEESYNPIAAVGSRMKGNDYRSIDIGILAAYITAEATAQGLATCIIGWLSDEKLRAVCGVTGAVRLVISLGYARADDPLREKKRKSIDKLVSNKK